jgi:hypothetical protein
MKTLLFIVLLYVHFFVKTVDLAPTPQPTPQPTRQPTSPTTLTLGLVAYYPFDGNSNDRSGNDHHGVIHGGVTVVADRFGYAGNALNFDGTSGYIEVSHGYAFNFPNNMTVALWIKSLATSPPDWTSLLDKSFEHIGVGLVGGFWVQQAGASQRTYFMRYIDTTITSRNSPFVPTQLGLWTHLAFTKSKNVLKSYINGTLVGSSMITADPSGRITSNGNLPLVIGAENTATDNPVTQPGRYFQGVMDDIFLYNRTLLLHEIVSLYSRQPTLSPTSQPTNRPSGQPSRQPSAQPTRQPMGRPTNRPSTQPSAQPSAQPMNSPSSGPSTQPTSQPIGRPTAQPSDQPTSRPTRQPFACPTTQPTGRPSVLPSSQPTMIPSGQPVSTPTRQPTSTPSIQPSDQPSARPSGQPSIQPTSQPSGQPTDQPSGQPTGQPSSRPFSLPSRRPTSQPSHSPSVSPTRVPTVQPMSGPSSQPTNKPSDQPSGRPSNQPSNQPLSHPTVVPSIQPKGNPSSSPSNQPTRQPSDQPTGQPLARPTGAPTAQPWISPTGQPTMRPTLQQLSTPSSQPTNQPSSRPTGQPFVIPSGQPTNRPSNRPSCLPTNRPSTQPSTQPQTEPTVVPSSRPTINPTCSPITRPSAKPSTQPTSEPTGQPSHLPSGIPSRLPTSQPSLPPTGFPSDLPSSLPSCQPKSEPTAVPTQLPTILPSSPPTSFPSQSPLTDSSSCPTSFPSDHFPSSNPATASDPTRQPTTTSTIIPTATPTPLSSVKPTSGPTAEPSIIPTNQPISIAPSIQSTLDPTRNRFPSSHPASAVPSVRPSSQPISFPTSRPSQQPTSQPTNSPSCSPSFLPTAQPTSRPSAQPSVCPTNFPTSRPYRQPIAQPSTQSTRFPVYSASSPSFLPSYLPTKSIDSNIPTRLPTSTHTPTVELTLTQSCSPSVRPVSTSVPPVSVFPFEKSVNFKISLFALGAYVPAREYIPNIDLTTDKRQIGSNYIIFGTKTRGRSRNKRKDIILDSRSAVGLYSFTSAGGLVVEEAMSRSVLPIGDFNGDSHEDLLICDPVKSKCFLYFSEGDGFSNLQVSLTMKSSNNDLFGWSIAKLNDLKKERFNDIAISALSSNMIYIFFGTNSSPTAEMVIDHSDQQLDSSVCIKIIGSQRDQSSGLALSSAGDFNSDGFEDILFSALQIKPYQSVIYILFLNAPLIKHDIIIDTLTPNIDYCKISAPLFSFAGFSLSNLGDINQDGFDDIIIGSIPYSGRYLTQKSYVIYGRNLSNGTLSLLEMNEDDGFILTGGGFMVAGPGDVNGDGINDIMISDYQQWQGKGNSYIMVYPQNMTTPPTFLPSSAPSSSPSRAPTALPSMKIQFPTSVPTIKETTNQPVNEGTFPPNLQKTLSPSLAPKTSKPTRIPSRKPSTQTPTVKTPSPTVSLSRTPTINPTKRPSIAPTTEIPSVSPTELHVPSSFPTSSPSATPTESLSTPFQEVTIDREGVYVVPSGGKLNYIITGEGNIDITSNRDAKKIFTLLPSKNVITITDFSIRHDQINVLHFPYLHSIDDLVYRSNPLTVFLSSEQRLILSDVEMTELSEVNFIFHSGTDRQKYKARFYLDLSAVITLGILIGCVGAFGCVVKLNDYEKDKNLLEEPNKNDMDDNLSSHDSDSMLFSSSEGSEEQKSDLSIKNEQHLSSLWKGFDLSDSEGMDSLRDSEEEDRSYFSKNELEMGNYECNFNNGEPGSAIRDQFLHVIDVTDPEEVVEAPLLFVESEERDADDEYDSDIEECLQENEGDDTYEEDISFIQNLFSMN